jgi:hypothetical protein
MRCPAWVAFAALEADVEAQTRISQAFPKFFIPDGSMARLTFI